MQGPASDPDAPQQASPGTGPRPPNPLPSAFRRSSHHASSPHSSAAPTSVGRGRIVWQLDHTFSADGLVSSVSEVLDLSAAVAADAEGPFNPSDVLECESYDVPTDGDEEKRSHQAPQTDPATSPDDLVSHSPTLRGEVEDHLKAISAGLVRELGPRFAVAGSEPESDNDDFVNPPSKRCESKQVPL